MKLPTQPPTPAVGARMTWNLVEALTGLETGDNWNNNGRGSNVVTVKTHYPQSNESYFPHLTNPR